MLRVLVWALLLLQVQTLNEILQAIQALNIQGVLMAFSTTIDGLLFVLCCSSKFWVSTSPIYNVPVTATVPTSHLSRTFQLTCECK